MSVSVSYVGSEGHFISLSNAIGSHNNKLPESLAAMAATPSRRRAPCTGATCTTPLLTQKATAANLAAATSWALRCPILSLAATYYSSNTVYQYYLNSRNTVA